MVEAGTHSTRPERPRLEKSVRTQGGIGVVCRDDFLIDPTRVPAQFDCHQMGNCRRDCRRCRRIVWPNPMMAWDGYAPEAAGIKAALPHVDLCAPANTLNSLTALEPYLAKL